MSWSEPVSVPGEPLETQTPPHPHTEQREKREKKAIHPKLSDMSQKVSFRLHMSLSGIQGGTKQGEIISLAAGEHSGAMTPLSQCHMELGTRQCH